MNLDAECLQLYRRSRELYLVGRVEEAEIIYRSLRRDHGVELFYEVGLPNLMRLVHPLGSVLGRATYADGLVCYQGASVGSTVDGERPAFMGPCVLFPHSAVIGNVTIGRNVWVTTGTIVQAFPGYPTKIPDNMLVYHRSDKTHGFRYTDRSVMAHYFPETNQ